MEKFTDLGLNIARRIMEEMEDAGIMSATVDGKILISFDGEDAILFNDFIDGVVSVIYAVHEEVDNIDEQVVS